MPSDILRTGSHLSEKRIHHVEFARRLAAAARVDEAQRVDGAAEVAEVPFDAASDTHPSVARRLHDDRLRRLTVGAERLVLTVFRYVGCRFVQK